MSLLLDVYPNGGTPPTSVADAGSHAAGAVHHSVSTLPFTGVDVYDIVMWVLIAIVLGWALIRVAYPKHTEEPW